MTLEDSRLYNRDVYALIEDFTSAFNTTDHDKLIWIIYDLGFPTDAIDTVKNLYQEPRTRVRLPTGRYTKDIPIEIVGLRPSKGTPSFRSSSLYTWNPCYAGSMLAGEAMNMSTSTKSHKPLNRKPRTKSAVGHLQMTSPASQAHMLTFIFKPRN
eukprot:1143564-Pelagomonas_calceolata.AAC.1